MLRIGRDFGRKRWLNCLRRRKSYRIGLQAAWVASALMRNLIKFRSVTFALCASVALAVSTPALAQHGGGGHGGYGGGHGGYGGWHGGYYGGWHGGYGYGWRGGYWGPWGWGWGGLYFATLPYYYSTYWWGGVPYYYADDTYYRWNPGVGQYETVAPPPGIQNQGGTQGTGPSDLIVYPKNGQSEDQLGNDKFECHRWAAGQTGFDPTQAGGGAAPGNRSDYFRAQTACLEGRGYSVK
jgi:hypothetical protein